MKNLVIMLLGFILSIFSCKKDDKLTIAKKTLIGNHLRLDGYYYTEYLKDYVTIYFLYNDGVLQMGNSILKKDLLNQEMAYKDGSFYSMSKNLKYYWGVFSINENEILMERWNPSAKPHKVLRREGKILNDTTFIMTKLSRIDGSFEDAISEVYYFKKFTPKPDSTNNFTQ